MTGENRHGEAIAGDGGGVDPGACGDHGKIINEESRFKIVGAIEEKIERTKEFAHIGRAEVGDDPFHSDAGIDGAQLLLRGNRFGQGFLGVGFIEEGLTLQVGRLDEIAVNDSQLTDASADQKTGCGSSNRTATDDDRTGGKQPFLAFRTDPGEKHLARIFLLERIIHERLAPEGARKSAY